MAVSRSKLGETNIAVLLLRAETNSACLWIQRRRSLHNMTSCSAAAIVVCRVLGKAVPSEQGLSWHAVSSDCWLTVLCAAAHL